jgi:hypothetical protein
VNSICFGKHVSVKTGALNSEKLKTLQQLDLIGNSRLSYEDPAKPILFFSIESLWSLSLEQNREADP